MNRRKILVIDDDRSMTALVRGILENTGRYTVRTENSGRWGLAAVREFEPDLVLLDVLLDDLDGGYVASRMKEDEESRHIPIVFLTAAVSRAQVDAQGGVIGGNYFLAKPVRALELIESLDRFLSHRSRADEPQLEGATT